MTGQNIVDLARGLIAVAKDSLSSPPYRITVPHGTNLQEFWEGENLSLEQQLKDLPDVKEVIVGKGRGVSIESIGQEKESEHLTAPR